MGDKGRLIMAKQLTVRARGTSSVSDFDALDRAAPLRRFLGRKYVEVQPGQWGFEPTGKDEIVSARAEVMKAIQDGELWAADAETAKYCGVVFDPTFGGTEKPSSFDASTKKKTDAGSSGGKGEL